MGWSKKYKKSINCSNPKGFSQKAHCAGRKARKRGETTKSKSVNEMKIRDLKEEIRQVIRERGVKSIQKDYSNVVSDMEKHLELYKKSKGTPEEKKHIEHLKALTAKKKKLQSELDTAVTNLYKNAELKVEESINEAPNTGEKIQNLNNRIGVLRAKITAQKDAVKRADLQRILKNALQKLSDIKKDHGIKAPHREGVNEAVSVRDGKYHFSSKDGLAQLTYGGKKIADGDFDFEGANVYFMSHSSFKGQKGFDTGKDVIAYFKKNNIVTESINEDGSCWDGYKQVGMKMKGGKSVPNCVPESVEVNEAFKHLISVETPTQVVSKPIAAQIEKLAKKGVKSSEIGLKMGFVGNQKLATDAFQKVKNKIYFALDKRNESVNEIEYKDAVEKFNADLMKNSQVHRISKFHKRSVKDVVKALQPYLKVLRYNDKSIKLVSIDFRDTNSDVKVHVSQTYKQNESVK